MRNLLSIALCLPLAACVIGDESVSGNGGGQGGSNDNGTGTPPADGSITGLISQDTSWSGTVLIGISGATTRIQPGVTVTVAPGTVLKFKSGAGLDIQGTLRIQGTSAGKVQIESAAGGSSYALILGGSPSAGKLEMAYAVMKGGNIQTSAGSSATITDSKMWDAPGDLLIMNGGAVTMSYSQIGPDPGGTSTTHCNIHTNGSANTINITRSNINGAPYGLMLYGGQNAIFTNNNWYNNQSDVDTQPNVSGDVSGSWFDGTPPTAGGGATLTANNLSATKLTDAGVRP